MATTVCSKCDVGWVIHSHDKHCGYCGCKVFDFAVKWEKEPLIYAGDGADIHDLTILIENTGAYPIAFQPIQTTRDNTVQFPQENNLFEVNAGHIYRVPIQVNPTNLERYAEVITVRAQNAPPNLESEKTLQLQTLPRPEFKLTPNPVILRYRRGTEKVTVDLHLEVLQGRFHISSMTKDSQPWVKNVQRQKGLHGAGTAAKIIRLDIDFNQLNDELNTVTLKFNLRGLSEPYTQQVRIQKEIVPEPPKLFVPKTNLYEVTRDREKEFTLTLQNTGELPLTIQNIAFNDPCNIVQLLNIEYPITIEGGAHHNVEVLVSAEGIVPKDHPIDFTINSDCEATPVYQDALNVRVNEREEYPHYLAIDFGTTNSCCAYIGPQGVPQLIELDKKANSPDIMPSVIVYHSLATNGNESHIGHDAEEYRTSPIDGPYYISSVKRWLGYNWKRQFPNNLQLQPSDVVAGILKHIIEQVEEHLDTLSTKSKITKCVIAHPTMFSLKQQEDLRRAFEKVGITVLVFIDEASAASLGVISQSSDEHRTLQQDYRLLVYDFGGGTIDIVLSQVTSNGNVTKIEPLAHGGNPRYGGDDVTQAIVDCVLDEFGQQIEKENSNLRFDIPYLSPKKIWQPSGNPTIIDRAKQLNTNFLYSRVEELKKELSEQEEASRDFPLSVVVGDEVRPLESYTQGNITVKISAEQLQSFIASELDQTFADIDAMISETGECVPETVILAGQSSKMPMVKEMMATHFQTKYQTDVDIYLSKSPKECVVIGAARHGMTYSLPAKDWIEIINPHKTYSSLGIMQASSGKEVFEEIIPKGKLIPDKSVGTTDFPLRTREIYIDVRERFGKNGKLSPIDGYTLRLPEDVSKEALRTAQLKMMVENEGKIKVIAIVDGKEYESEVEKKEPEFVDEI